jgi:hypothetical protein
MKVKKEDLIKFLKEKNLRFDEKEIIFKDWLFKDDDFEVTLTMFVPDKDYPYPFENLFGGEKVVISIDREVYEWWLKEKNCISIVGRY